MRGYRLRIRSLVKHTRQQHCSLTNATRVQAQRGAGATSFQKRDVLAVPIKVISIGKPIKGAAQDLAGLFAADEWAAKIKRYTAVEQVHLKGNPKRASEPEAQQKFEAEALLGTLDGRDYVVVLDERGSQFTSFDLAHCIATAGDRSSRSISFCIGGPYGHADSVRKRADATVSLSKCVLNHQIARLVILEQLFRAWTIIRGEPYHH